MSGRGGGGNGGRGGRGGGYGGRFSSMQVHDQNDPGGGGRGGGRGRGGRYKKPLNANFMGRDRDGGDDNNNKVWEQHEPVKRDEAWVDGMLLALQGSRPAARTATQCCWGNIHTPTRPACVTVDEARPRPQTGSTHPPVPNGCLPVGAASLPPAAGAAARGRRPGCQAGLPAVCVGGRQPGLAHEHAGGGSARPSAHPCTRLARGRAAAAGGSPAWGFPCAVHPCTNVASLLPTMHPHPVRVRCMCVCGHVRRVVDPPKAHTHCCTSACPHTQSTTASFDCHTERLTLACCHAISVVVDWAGLLCPCVCACSQWPRTRTAGRRCRRWTSTSCARWGGAHACTHAHTCTLAHTW